jgi:MSHA biogenesis protein MshG
VAVFKYSGRDRQREAVVGHLEAATIYAAANQLTTQGITPIDIEPADDVPAAATLQSSAAAHQDVGASLQQLLRRFGQGQVELLDLIFFSRQMHTLLRAGVPILKALQGLRETTSNVALGGIIEQLSSSLDSGLDLTSAFRRHPQVFSTLFISMVQVGESTGNLPEAFLQLAFYLEREKDTRDRIKQAVRYPIFVIIAIGIALAIINLFVIPAFASVFKSFHAELPWATRILIATSEFSLAYWHVTLATLVALAVAARRYVATARGRYRWHRYQLRLPLIGELIFQASLARFARSLSVTLKAGVPLVQGLMVVSRAVDNDYIGERVTAMREGVERGESITRTAHATGLFPPMVLQMIAVGEESGTVDELLREVAQFYEGEVDYNLKNLSAAIEPILITFIGAVVLVLALGVFLPMWDLAQVAQHR